MNFIKTHKNSYLWLLLQKCPVFGSITKLIKLIYKQKIGSDYTVHNNNAL